LESGNYTKLGKRQERKMTDKVYPLSLSFGVLALLAVAYYVGLGEGRQNACDVLRTALLESSSVGNAIEQEFSENYLNEIHEACRW
jgi:hypothetical protein